MDKEPIPIGRGEQISLERKLNAISENDERIKEFVNEMLEIRKQIEHAYAAEMEKPEWARRQNVLNRLKAELEENDQQLNRLLNIATDMQLISDYIANCQKEFEGRIEEKGY